MRVSLPLLATVAVAAVCLVAGPAVADLQLANLVGHWKLDSDSGNTAVDSLNGNNGAWQNGDQVNLTWPTGFLGNAAKIDDDSGNSFFRIPSITQLEGGTGWTISTWINPDPQTGYNGIFMSRSVNGGGSWGMALEGNGPFHTDNRMSAGGGLDTPDDIDADDEVGSLGGWYHLANTWNASDGVRKAYINGALVAESPADAENGAVGAISSGGSWDIGYDDCCGGGRDFEGLIDDLAFWKAPLADADILEVYNNGLAGKDATGNSAPLPPVEGDVDGDRIVDNTDFEIIRGAFFESVLTREEGDLTGDGFVDFDDFNQWKVAANAATAAAAVVPEPTCLVLFVLAAACVAPRRRAA